jgi:Cys-tRNA(Pro) deacylase
MTEAPEDAPAQLLAAVSRHGIDAEFLRPGVPMPTVNAAAQAISVPEEQILKTLLFANKEGKCVVAIANGNGRVDRTLLAEASGLSGLRVASSESVLEVTGYPAGGVAPIGIAMAVPVVVDRNVLALPVAYGGGGRETLLLRIAPADIVRLNQAIVADIVRRELDVAAG